MWKRGKKTWCDAVGEETTTTDEWVVEGIYLEIEVIKPQPPNEGGRLW